MSGRGKFRQVPKRLPNFVDSSVCGTFNIERRVGELIHKMKFVVPNLTEGWTGSERCRLHIEETCIAVKRDYDSDFSARNVAGL